MKPVNFGHMHSMFVAPNGAAFSSVQEMCIRKKTCAKTMTHAQETCAKNF